jgi:hypothetical protein
LTLFLCSAAQGEGDYAITFVLYDATVVVTKRSLRARQLVSWSWVPVRSSTPTVMSQRRSVGVSRKGKNAQLLKGNGVATLAQNKIFPAKQEPLLSEITGLLLDAQMQRNRLDVDERVEGSR